MYLIIYHLIKISIASLNKTKFILLKYSFYLVLAKQKYAICAKMPFFSF